jgi:uncharacterized membrane protein
MLSDAVRTLVSRHVNTQTSVWRVVFLMLVLAISSMSAEFHVFEMYEFWEVAQSLVYYRGNSPSQIGSWV